MDIIISLTLIFIASLVGGICARKLKQPAVLGYVLSGILVGNFALSLLGYREVIFSLSEIGVAFLMFTLGIEFSLKKLSRVRQVALWGGVIQILAVLLLGVLVFPRFGFEFYTSFFLASCFSLSSTAVVTKILFERGETGSLPGEIMIGWLLVQDLAVLPMILILPKIAGVDSGSFWQIILALAKAIFVLIFVVFSARRLMPKLLDQVARIGSSEILLLTIVGVVLIFSLGTFFLGLSFALGAFLAGLILAETSQNHAIFSEIKPLRDVFSIVFFVSLGMLFPPSFLISSFSKIILLSLLVVLAKLVVVTSLVLYLGYHTKTAFLVGMGLVSVGEFSFILARLGILQGLISEEIYSFIVSVCILTIALTPFFFSLAPKIYYKFRKWSARKMPRIYFLLFTRFDKKLAPEERSLKNHVVICGYGRVGFWLSRSLEISDIPQVVVDYDFRAIEKAQEKKIPSLYGDPADIDVLRQAGVAEAKIVVLAIPDFTTTKLVVGNILTLNRNAQIICRTHHREEIPELKALGVKGIIQPEFEASLSIIYQVFKEFSFSKEETEKKIKQIRKEHGTAGIEE